MGRGKGEGEGIKEGREDRVLPTLPLAPGFAASRRRVYSGVRAFYISGSVRISEFLTGKYVLHRYLLRITARKRSRYEGYKSTHTHTDIHHAADIFRIVPRPSILGV